MENINDYVIPWWDNYDGDIEEERLSKIGDPENMRSI